MTLAPQHQAAVEAAPRLDDEQAATITALMRSVSDAVGLPDGSAGGPKKRNNP